ncbi:ABC transporter ATP-binding protein/permease [Candidatus Pelagibacter sp.]|nr:ABC transporter ATP-binding protein/permease [Candidatus Pelagibacter sp.]
MKNYFSLLKQIFLIIPKEYSKKLKLIFFALSIAGVLEALGIGLLIPLISEILNDDSHYLIKNYLSMFFELNKIELIQFLSVCILLLYLFKSIYLTKLEFFIQKFNQNIKADLTLQLFNKYTNNSYEFNVNNNSSILLRNLTSEISNFSAGLLRPAIMFAKEFFIIALLLVMLLTINFKISLFIIIFSSLFVYIVQNYSVKILENLGKSEQSIKGQENKIIIETLQGIKFIKSYSIENIYKLKLNQILKKFVTVKSKSNAIKLLPRIWVELFLFLFLIFLGLGFKFFNLTLINFVTFSSIFLITMLKVMPSLISAIKVLNVLNSYKASIDLISQEFIEQIKGSKKNISLEDINIKSIKEFAVKNIFFKYSNSKNVIEDLSLKIKTENDFIVIYGDSGSGKTTLVDILIGLLKPTNGHYELDGNKIDNNLLKNFFGYIPQNTFLFDDTIRNNILITNRFPENLIEEKFKEILNITQLSKLVDTLPDKENTLIGENGSRISGGQKQRISIARALMSDPKVLIFDEATSGLDKNTEEKIFENLKTISKTNSIIVISHNPFLRRYCNTIYKLSEKKLIKL